MPLYDYKAARPDGQLTEGQLQAETLDALVQRLHEDGQIFISAEAKRSKHRAPPAKESGSVRQRDVLVFTLELATLLEAGLPLDRALTTLETVTENGTLRALVRRLRDAVRGGDTFSAALESEHNTFSRLYINLVKAGETSGALGRTLRRLGEYLESRREMSDALVAALLYPVILVIIAGVSLVLMLAVVVPRFAKLLQDAGQALPLPTQIVMALGSAVADYWWALAVVVSLTVLVAQRQLADPVTRHRIDGWLLKVPLVGEVMLKLDAARFARTLTTLLDNGVPLPNSLGILENIVSNRAVAASIEEVTRLVRNGQSLASALQQTNTFPQLVAHLVEIGEETGTLQPMLERLSEIYEREVKRLLQRLIAIAEPVLIVGIGVVIGGIIFSILTAVLTVNEVAL